MRTRLALAAACSAAVFSPLLTACSNDDGPATNPSAAASATAEATTPPTSPPASETSPSQTPTRTDSSRPPEGPSLSISIKGETVRPNAQELDVVTGEPLVLTIESDRAGELHVHSKPEQFVEFEAGTSTRRLTIETPGSVEIEEHETSAVVAIVAVR